MVLTLFAPSIVGYFALQIIPTYQHKILFSSHEGEEFFQVVLTLFDLNILGYFDLQISPTYQHKILSSSPGGEHSFEAGLTLFAHNIKGYFALNSYLLAQDTCLLSRGREILLKWF